MFWRKLSYTIFYILSVKLPKHIRNSTEFDLPKYRHLDLFRPLYYICSVMINNYLIAICLAAASPASNLFQKAETYYSAGKLGQASDEASNVVVSAIEYGDTTNLIKAYCLLANVAIDRGNDLEAVDYYNKCADLLSYCEPMFMLSSSLYNIATIYFQNGENDKALDYISKSILINSRRGSDSILALKYLLASEILFKKGEYAKAIEMADNGRQHTRTRKNNNVEARLMLVIAKCHEAMAGPDPDWGQIVADYKSALEVLNTLIPSHYYYGAVNPYAPEFLYRIGLAVAANGGDAKEYFLKAIEGAGSAQKMRGANPLVEIESCKAIADLLDREGNEAEAGKYRERAEFLSFVPYVTDMSNKLSLSQMEFIRREKEIEIERQKYRSLFLTIIVSILSISIILLLLLYHFKERQRKMIEQKNAQLVKLGLQKVKLVSMLQENAPLKSDDAELNAIANDSVPFPEIKLSKREREVLEYCCKGLISKEIAAKMDVSVRTVESHKLNLFRKIGVNTTNELIAFAFKSGFIK